MNSTSTHARTVLWEPSESDRGTAALTGFIAWVNERHGLTLSGYRDTLDWSVTDISGFWGSVREYFDVLGDGFDGPALAVERMPGAEWYPDARLNYAENILRHASDPALSATTAIVDLAETGEATEISWSDLERKVASLAAELRALGVEPGDRVAAVLPNVPEAIIGLLAAASIGAVWCICSPDLAVKATLDRLRQLDAVVLIGSLGYRFNGRWFDRTEHLSLIEQGLPSIRHTLVVGGDASGERILLANLLTGRPTPRYERVAFDHPLWVLFTSGTTGTPKGIVHGHGGMTLEALKCFGLHFGMGPGDRYYVAANTSWMVWNTVIGNLLTGASVVTYAGSPVFGRVDRQFDIVARTGVTMFGTGAAYLRLVQAAGLIPADDEDLSRLRTVMSTGSTLPDSTALWVRDAVNPALHLSDLSGGTDICSAFLGSNPLEPVRLGRIQGPLLGVALEVRDDAGRRVVDQVGEMVITRPMPSMPVFFWGDADGALYRAAYFERFAGVWTHGDWILEAGDGTFEVLGRSDATLNRAGVRLGSAEIYGAVQQVDAVADSLAIGVELPEGEYYLPLFVVLAPGRQLDEELRGTIVRAIREHASARHVPDEILAVPALPVTHAGKKIEIPIKRLFAGMDPASLDRGALANADSLEWFIECAREFRRARGLGPSDATTGSRRA